MWTARDLTGYNMHHWWDWAANTWASLAFHQPVLLPFGPFYKSKNETCCRKCKQSYLNFYLCYIQILQKEECMRVWTGTQWWGCLDSNVCNPNCPSASVTALTQLTPIPLLLSLSQVHKPALLRNLFSHARAKPGWLQCRHGGRCADALVGLVPPCRGLGTAKGWNSPHTCIRIC